jgi:hypothetical protein
MIKWRARTRRIAAIAVVAAMHVLFLRLLILEIEPAFSPAEVRLTVSLIATLPHKTSRARSASRRMVSKEHETPAGGRQANSKRRLRQVRNQLAPEAPLRGRIDWEQALQSGAQDTISRSDRQNTLTFGFAKSGISSLSDGDREWDGWDFAATHRVGMLPRGGTAIRINDHCSIVLVPLPLFGCFPEKVEVNGDLFKDLRKARSGNSTGLP